MSDWKPFPHQAKERPFLRQGNRMLVWEMGCIAGTQLVSAKLAGRAEQVMPLMDLFDRFHATPEALRVKAWRIRGMGEGNIVRLLHLEAAVYKGTQATIEISIGRHTKLILTPDHEVMVPGGGYVRADSLRPGVDRIMVWAGTQLRPKAAFIMTVKPAGNRPVYDLTTETPHSNFVANGVVVHNCGKTGGALHAWEPKDGPLNIVAPSALLRQWGREASRMHPDVPCQVIEEGKTPVTDAPIAITSYALLTRNDKLVHALGARQHATLVLDEAQYLKTPTSGRTKRIYGTSKPTPALRYSADRVWGLSGGLAPNHVVELWTHYAALFPTALGPLTMDYETFKHAFGELKPGPFGKTLAGTKNIPILADAMRPHMSNVKLRDVKKDMPPLMTDSLPLTLDEGVMAELTAMQKDFRQSMHDIREAMKSRNPHAVFEIIRSQEVHLATLRKNTGVAKAPAVAQYALFELENMGTDRLVIFVWHRDVGDIIAATINAELPGQVRMIRGGTSNAERDAAKQAFRQGAVRALILNIQAGGVGMDGLQHVAHRCLFAEWSWTPLDNQQAIARLLRIGQTLPVLALFATAYGTMDDMIGDAAARKAADLSAYTTQLEK